MMSGELMMIMMMMNLVIPLHILQPAAHLWHLFQDVGRGEDGFQVLPSGLARQPVVQQLLCKCKWRMWVVMMLRLPRIRRQPLLTTNAGCRFYPGGPIMQVLSWGSHHHTPPQYNTIQCNANNTIQYNTIQYKTVLRPFSISASPAGTPAAPPTGPPDPPARE